MCVIVKGMACILFAVSYINVIVDVISFYSILFVGELTSALNLYFICSHRHAFKVPHTHVTQIFASICIMAVPVT